MKGRGSREAREVAMKFMYRCEIEHIYYYAQALFEQHCNLLEIKKNPLLAQAESLCKGTYGRLNEIDALLSESSHSWSLERMPPIDRCILRLAVYELLELDTPLKVVLNEAVEMAKSYGSGSSGAFVNGVLDAVARRLSLQS